MALIRTPNGIVDDGTGPQGPNIGNAVIAGAPAATLTDPMAAAAQPPNVQPVGAGVPAALPVPPVPTTGMRASPDQAPVGAIPPNNAVRSPTAPRAAVGRGPSSGVSTPVDDALIRAKADEAVQQSGDQLSPTTMVLNYLQRQGLPRTSENVRRALEANARDNTTIPGLINQAPPAPTAIDTQANAPGRGGPGRATSAAPAPATPAPPGGSSAAAPGAGNSTNMNAADIAALALGGGLGGAAAYYLRNKLNGAKVAPDAADALVGEYTGRGDLGPTGRVIDVPPTALTGPGNRTAITDQSTSAAPSRSTDATTTRAIDRATDTAVPPPPVTNAGDVTADDVRAAIRANRIKLPPGVTEEQLAAAANRGGSQNLIRFGGPRNASTAAEAARMAAEAAAAARARPGRFRVW
jgi:hypothetical protein